MAKWLRPSVLNLVGSTKVSWNPITGSTNHNPAASSAVHPSEARK